MNPKTTYFKLFECCKPVKGKNRTTIYDLQREEIFFVPNEIHDLLVYCGSNTIEDVFKKYGEENKSALQEYFVFFVENELGFYTEEPDSFPKMSDEWKSPYRITNSIIDVKETSNHNYKSILNQLHALNCQAIQLRFFDVVSVKHLDLILSLAKGKCFKSVEIFANKCNDLNSNKGVEGFLSRNHLISHLHLFNKNEKKFYRNGSGVYITQSLKEMELNDCGIISPHYFTPSLSFYTEALHYNTCLNKKISIDWDGEIKNCPSMKKSYGNVSNTTLSDVIENKEFIKYWHIKKDDIEECKQCEFRYVCSDCRAYLKKPSNIYSKPAKCNFNINTGNWE